MSTGKIVINFMFKTNSEHFEGVSEKKFILPDQIKEQEYKLKKSHKFFMILYIFFFRKWIYLYDS